tara:strand:+ start:5882 stop:6559 length:678 start_codon:yes stop_codon:yes gene_type:complete
MTIRIAHCSDTHGSPSTVRQVASLDVDLILLTGDCISNLGRVQRTGGLISPKHEIRYQESWFRKQAKKWAKDIGDRPVISVRGNHDFICPSYWLRHYGVTVHVIDDNNPSVELFGKTWAGFRHVPEMGGEWCGERKDFDDVIEAAFACNPDILVTHAPPAGILECGDGGHDLRGIPALATALAYRPHNITHHFFGHAHSEGCEVVTEMGIYFANGAGGCHVHTIE